MEHYILVKWNPDAPERFDRSKIHSEWKRQFGQKIEKKQFLTASAEKGNKR